MTYFFIPANIAIRKKYNNILKNFTNYFSSRKFILTLLTPLNKHDHVLCLLACIKYFVIMAIVMVRHYKSVPFCV